MSEENNNKKIILTCIIIILAIILLLIVTLPLSELIVNNNEIAVIEINGEINYLNSTNSSSIESIEMGIEEANNNPNVKAIVVEVNSKNGSLIASEEISKMIKNTTKPTVSWISDYGLSEGYLIASSADTVVATPSSSIGGIGINFKDSTKYSNKKLSGHYNEDLINKTYNLSNDSKNNFKSSNLVNAQKMIDQDYNYFIKLIADNRGLTTKYISQLSGSKIYNGNEALTVKLIDEIGDKNKAIELATLKANITEYSIVKYPQDNSNKLTTFLNQELSKIGL